MTFGSAAVRVLTATLFAMAAQSFGQEFAPFVIPAESAPDSPIAFRGRPIGADSPRMTVRDGHFFVGDRRFRAWGVNLCYGANFPPHDQAERMAAHLEAFGVNTVRFHHMDCEWFRFPRSIWDADEPTKLSAEALDRLDYFIDRLARRGIHANLNLHVSRIHSRHLGLPDTKATGSYDKMVDIFTPKLIEAQKEYARSLLTRVNRYRGMRYADDPAVAFVEINNEDSLFLWNWQENLRNMAPPYAEILRGRYNEWLRACYGSTGKLAAAWKVPGGADEKPVSTRLPLAGKGASWTLTRHSGADAQAQPLRDADGVRLTPGKLASAVWHLEYSVAGLEARTDRFYTLRFRARSDAPRQIVCRFGQADAPYRSLGLRINVAIDKTWREHRFEFQPPQAESNARVSFLFAQSAAPFEIADVELVSQPIAGLRDGESLVKATVALLATGESQARLLDRLRFLAETEKRYYDDFRKFLKDDLGCKALVTGTMVNGPLGLWAQSDMDYLDTHAYWSHPSFPKGWNRKNWSMDQKAMTDLPRNNVLSQVAACRLAGKPLTLSEYNHPAPNDAQAECVPMVAAMAAAQDWDGVWLFAFTDRGEGWDAGAFDGWFDFAGNPSKWGFVPLGAAIFRDGGIEPLPKGKVYPLAASPDPLGELA
ncbi:MAG TPA: cellulase family glycosylhydrolase, partial [Phycisphaerae bacterium]|nr:cellulase family glycosylhydrolase [Phycisphaerae bacterium]